MTISTTIFGKPSQKKVPFLLAHIDLIPKEISTPIGLMRYASYMILMIYIGRTHGTAAATQCVL